MPVCRCEDISTPYYILILMSMRKLRSLDLQTDFSKAKVWLATCHAYRCHQLLPFYTTSIDFDFGWRSHCQWKVKPVGFIFLHTFQLKGIKFCELMKYSKLNILKQLLSEIYVIKRNTCCFTDIYKTFYCLHYNWTSIGVQLLVLTLCCHLLKNRQETEPI